MPRSLMIWLLALAGIYCSYAGVMIHDSSLVLEGKRWFALLDDPMISMRYARNLAAGNGLVWNAGERVEGITNPGWTLIMAAVHLVEKDLARTSLYVQLISLLCNLVTLTLTALATWRLSRGSMGATIAAFSMVAFYFPVSYWSLMGMETGLLATLIMAAFYLSLRHQEASSLPVGMYLFMGAATLVRIDAAVPLVILGGYHILNAPARSLMLRHAVVLSATVVVFVGGQTLARFLYYGYPFPNTYYLKMTGYPVLSRVLNGLRVTLQSIVPLLWPVAVLALAGIAVAYRKSRVEHDESARSFSGLTSSPVTLASLLVLGQVAYSIYVGGDAWEHVVHWNRYLVIVIPPLAIAITVTGLWLTRQIGVRPPGRYRHFAYAAMLGVIIPFINWNCCAPILKPEVYLLTSEPLIQHATEEALKLALTLEKSAPDAKVAHEWAGTMFYFLDRFGVDPLGKCDVHIAHLPESNAYYQSGKWKGRYFPGHMKWDMAWTVGHYQPEYVALRFEPIYETSRELMDSAYVQVELPPYNLPVFVRKDLAQ